LGKGRCQALEVSKTFCGALPEKIPAQDIFNGPFLAGDQALVALH
jgi:hypothetical protein